MSSNGNALNICRREHKSPAYRDQTGKPQNGYVVYERLTVTDTGMRFDHNDGYKVYIDHIRIYRAGDGREFRVWSETVDYAGGTHVIPPRMLAMRLRYTF